LDLRPLECTISLEATSPWSCGRCTQDLSKPVIHHSDALATENPLHQFTRKARHFEFEKEVRLIAWPTSEDIVFSYKFEQSSVNDVGQVSPNIKDMNRLISRIIFSPGIPDDCVEAVTQVCRAQSLTCDMVKSALDEKPMLDVYGYLAAYPKP
jgi:hypothetical protein